MNSKECLEFILNSVKLPRQFPKETTFKLCVKKVKQDLDRLEELEKINQYLNKQLDLFFKNMSANERKACDILGYENDRLYKVIEILKDKLDIKLEVYHNGGCTLNHKVIHNCITSDERCLRHLEVEEYELLKEEFGYE